MAGGAHHLHRSLIWPTAALVVTQIVHGATPVDEDHVDSEGPLGLIVGGLLLLASISALIGLVQRRPYAPSLAARTGLAVAVGFVAYHGVPWANWFTNPYLGKPVGAPAWVSVAVAVGAAAWCAWVGRHEIVPGRSRRPATA